MGTFLVKRDGTLRGAIDAFGTPGDRDRRFGGAACRPVAALWAEDRFHQPRREKRVPPCLRVLFRRPCPRPPLADQPRSR